MRGKTKAGVKAVRHGSDSVPMTPRPPTRRLSALLTSLIGLSLLGALVAPTASGAGRRAIELQGDPAVGPSAAAAPGVSTRSSAASFTDVPSNHWARTAIQKVATDNAWMRDFGDAEFRPEDIESRKLFARAVVLAFAPTEKTDPKLTFADLPATDPFFPFANVAAKLGWMGVKKNGTIRPDAPVTIMQVHRALVRALDLGEAADGADAIHTSDGVALKHRAGFGTLLLGRVLGLRYNHSTESMELPPTAPLPRAEVAWSLYRASVVDTTESWRKSSVQVYADIKLGKLNETTTKVMEFALRYVGHPYVYAGEWHSKTPSGYCCGAQTTGGFDCSGLMWWLLRVGDSLYNNVSIRGYKGWALNQRSSHDMAYGIPAAQRLAYDDLSPGDLMFYDSNRDGRIDHVNMYAGWGWAVDSGGNGVTLTRVNDGWYEDYFKWGRRIISA